jgi:hypothetical protein
MSDGPDQFDGPTLGKLLESLEAGWYATETGPQTDRAIAAALRQTLYGTDTEPGLVERIGNQAETLYTTYRGEHHEGYYFDLALAAEIGTQDADPMTAPTHPDDIEALQNAHSGAMTASANENHDEYRMYETQFYAALAQVRTLVEATRAAEVQLDFADTFINGEHDICEMCEALVFLRSALAPFTNETEERVSGMGDTPRSGEDDLATVRRGLGGWRNGTPERAAADAALDRIESALFELHSIAEQATIRGMEALTKNERLREALEEIAEVALSAGPYWFADRARAALATPREPTE